MIVSKLACCFSYWRLQRSLQPSMDAAQQALCMSWTAGGVQVHKLSCMCLDSTVLAGQLRSQLLIERDARSQAEDAQGHAEQQLHNLSMKHGSLRTSLHAAQVQMISRLHH